MKSASNKKAVELANTTRLGSFNDGPYSYHFFSAPIEKGFSLVDVSDCLNQRYKKYGEVVFERRTKNFSDLEEVLFTVIEPILNASAIN